MSEGVRRCPDGARQLVTSKIKDHTCLEILGPFGEAADMAQEIRPAK